jgi:hypothetical protein
VVQQTAIAASKYACGCRSMCRYGSGIWSAEGPAPLVATEKCYVVVALLAHSSHYCGARTGCGAHCVAPGAPVFVCCELGLGYGDR